MKKKVIVAGHICLDVTPKFFPTKVNQLSDILSPGKLINVGGADVHAGGAVANTGLGMKILGADVTLMGKIGDDAFGSMICNTLNHYEAGDDLLIAKEDTTSYSVILAIPGIDRIFLHNTGANDSFCADDIPKDALEEAVLLHFGYPPLMKTMFSNEGAELIKLMKRAQEYGVATSLDFASIDPASEAGAADWEGILKNVIPCVDFLVPSIEELCFMLDKVKFQEWQDRAEGRDITEMIDLEADIKPLAQKCMDLGAKVLLIKCGAKGMYYRTACKDSLRELCGKLEMNLDQWAEKEGFEESYVPDRVLSGTGAGDTSIAAFLTAALKGYSLEDTMHLAAGTGASCVEAYDALSGLKSFEELEAKMKAGWKKRSEI